MEVLTDADGWILIGTLLTPVDQSLMVSWTDRNGKHFGAILNYLRDGTIPLPETRRELMELQVAMSSNLETILISPSVWILPSWYSVSSRHCASGRGQVLLCGRAGAGHRAEPGQIRSGGETCLVLQNLSVSKMMVVFKGSDVVPICRVPLITSQREEQALITANNMKPVVKLLINR